jgi:hypothetical protein
MTTTEEKQNETPIVKHILQANKYNTSFDNKHNKQQNRNNNPNPTNKKWAKFTFIGKDTRIITKLFKHTNIWIAFTTKTTWENYSHHAETTSTLTSIARMMYTN